MPRWVLDPPSSMSYGLSSKGIRQALFAKTIICMGQNHITDDIPRQTHQSPVIQRRLSNFNVCDSIRTCIFHELLEEGQQKHSANVNVGPL